ncbi:MAG: right-handed parallel beta-helix repeat-containing protein [Planctomycetota bacterium]|nr:right-handed parallel beta-helix repeat-containing protein [Planctomycetota bacterium]
MANVRDFGAVGDGKSDDTQAIQHAINDGDGQVEFGRGNFLVTRSLLLDTTKTGRAAISGNGGTAKVLMAGAGPAFKILGTHASTADPAGFRAEEWEKERMPTISGIEIEGRHPEADGVFINGVMQPTLCSVLIREVRHAVHIGQRARNLLIDQCHFYHNRGIGVFLDNVNLHQSIISSSHISYCRLGGIRIENSEIRNLQITGNDIEYNNAKSHKELKDEPTAEIFIDVGEKGTIREGTISSNTIQSTYSAHGANIRFIGSSEKQPGVNHRAGMWTITGNLIGSQKNNIHLTAIRGVIISGNYIYSGHHRNILIEESRNVVIGSNCMGHNPDYRKNELATGIRIQDTENLNIQGLLIEDAEAGKHTVGGAVPIQREALLELVHCRRVNVSGTQVLEGTPVGILVRNCEETLLSGCTVLDDRKPRLMETGIRWDGAGTGNAIVNCRVGSGAKESLRVDASVKQSGNLVGS